MHALIKMFMHTSIGGVKDNELRQTALVLLS